MRELLKLALKFDIKGLLITPTSNVLIQAFRAFFVGGVAFIADAGVLWLLSLTGAHYLFCVVFGFIVGVTVNYILSIRFVFKERAAINRSGEIAVYLVISLIGLGWTELLMWLFTEIAGFHFMASKCAAAMLVFVWNFTARKFLLYRKG